MIIKSLILGRCVTFDPCIPDAWDPLSTAKYYVNSKCCSQFDSILS